MAVQAMEVNMGTVWSRLWEDIWREPRPSRRTWLYLFIGVVSLLIALILDQFRNVTWLLVGFSFILWSVPDVLPRQQRHVAGVVRMLAVLCILVFGVVVIGEIILGRSIA